MSLALTRKPGERIAIQSASGTVWVHWQRSASGNVQIVTEAPREVVVLREESLVQLTQPKPVTLEMYQCCEQAVREFCVCVARWKCPVHGTHCHGSHD